MILATDQIIAFKVDYAKQMEQGSIKVLLTSYHIGRPDAWAYDILGDAEYSFMYPILIHNEDDAMDEGYYIAGVENG